MRTSSPPAAKPSWFLADAEGKNLGRLATRLAHVLRGKHKPSFSAHRIMGDHIVVVNAAGIAHSAEKVAQKVFHRHSGTLGNLKVIPLKKLLQEDPGAVLARSVRGMLPRNRLRPLMMKHLHIFAGAEHSHAAQQPRPFEELFPARRLPAGRQVAPQSEGGPARR